MSPGVFPKDGVGSAGPLLQVLVVEVVDCLEVVVV